MTIDVTYLHKLREAIGGEDADLMEMIESFLDEVPTLATALSKSIAEGDTTGARRAAHSLKSNTRDFGALQLSKAYSAIEDASSKGLLTDQGEVTGLHTSLEQVFMELRGILARRTL